MRVLVDARMFMGRFSGVSRFVSELVHELVRHGHIEPVLLVGPETPQVAALQGVRLLRCSFTRRDRTPFRRLFWELTCFPRYLRLSGADVFHATWNSCPTGTIPTVLTIHDLIPPAAEQIKVRPPALSLLATRISQRMSVRSASRIATVSDYVGRQVAARFNIPLDQVSTIYHGVKLPAAPPHRFTLPYVLYVGGHERRKNVGGLFHGMEKYWKRYGADLDLRLTGTIESLSDEACLLYAALSAKERVHFLGQPSDGNLAGLYRGATALVMLSTDEGFGLPVLEAMSLGCPVICSRCASLPEVAGNAAYFVNHCDPDEVANAIYVMASDRAIRDSHVTLGIQRSAAFTWRRAAQDYIRLYHQAVSASPKRASAPADDLAHLRFS